MTKYHFNFCLFSDTMLCCLANKYCCFRDSSLLQNVSNYSMTEMASHPTTSTPMWEPQILKYHLFVRCLEITNINKGTINRILETNNSFHCRTYFGSDIKEVQVVYSVCVWVTTQMELWEEYSHSRIQKMVMIDFHVNMSLTLPSSINARLNPNVICILV